MFADERKLKGSRAASNAAGASRSCSWRRYTRSGRVANIDLRVPDMLSVDWGEFWW